MGLDYLGKLKVPCNNGHLEGCLAVVIADVLVGTTEKQDSGTALLVIEGTDVQGCVSRGVLGTHVGPIEQQVLQVLHMPKATGLMDLLPAILVSGPQLCVIMEKQLTAEGIPAP